MFGDVYRGRRVLITGHTGFKGSWLALWLQRLGAKVHGFALAPETVPNHWDLLGLQIADRRGDIRDASEVRQAIADADPEFVFHLAAQPLVRRSYRDPLETWSTNVMGTANLLEACRARDALRAVVVVTSDKCYANDGRDGSYAEDDRLGGHDPYSASKAAAEIATAGFRDAFFASGRGTLIASGRAGNVIGGGDWAMDRLVPDAARAVAMKSELAVRYPDSVRPWQHVLDSLSGYLLLGARLADARREFAGAWNFGPDAGGDASVAGVLSRLQAHWPDLRWKTEQAPAPHEARLLRLDNGRARTLLRWQSVWALEEAVAETAHWYRRFLEKGEVSSAAQLSEFEERARSHRMAWAIE